MKKFKTIVKTVLFNKIIRLWRLNINEYSLEFINAPLKELKLKNTDKCLVFAPHADDESIGLGGLLLKNAALFDIICVTDCSLGTPAFSPEISTKLRENEFKKAMTLLGVNKWFFNTKIKDSKLSYSYNDFETMLHEININKFNIIFLPQPFDMHPDHIALTRHFRTFCKNKSIKGIQKIIFYEVWSPITSPNMYFNISSLRKQKETLINIYKSQTEIIDYANKIISLNTYRGMILNMDCVECFQVISIEEFLKLPF